MPITDNISSVDGVISDIGGNVNLSAVRYVAQTLEDAQKVQARKNIGVDGQIYPCTATALEAMSSSDLVGIYNQGYRAVQTTNNETVVTLALAADGSLAWQGCNEDTTNLLDNPNFAVAQAGYGGKHGNSIYAADRWPVYNATLSSGEEGKITIVGGESEGNIYQRFFPKSGPVTIGYFDASENLYLINANIPDVLGAGPIPIALNQYIQVYVNENTIQVNFVVNAGETITFAKAFCYSGSYTQKTLPPWKFPDHMSEYRKCRRYYKALTSYGRIVLKPYGEVTVATVNSDEMRILPSAEVNNLQIFDDTLVWIPATVASVTWMGDGYLVKFNVNATISNGETYLMQGLTGLSADL